jgi:tetratricopeptide (TPR) repeat protein
LGPECRRNDRQHEPGWTATLRLAKCRAPEIIAAQRGIPAAAITLAADSGLGTHAWQLAWCLATYLDWQGYWPEWEAAQRVVLDAARLTSDVAGHAHAERQLGRLRLQRGPYAAAEAHLLRALALFRAAGDGIAQARSRLDIAMVCEREGRYVDAIPHILGALDSFRAAGHRSGQARGR